MLFLKPSGRFQAGDVESGKGDCADAAMPRQFPWVLAVALAMAPAPGASELAYRDGEGSIRLALTGDSIITRRLSVHEEPAFMGLRKLIRDADAAFTNLEMLFHDFGDGVIPAANSGGSYMRADPDLARELAWMGFDLVSRANNHAMDYGVGGLRATTRAVEKAGLMHAGIGENLALAREPAYLDTGAGRVALVSVASTFPDGSEAGPRRDDVRGRPGLSPLYFGDLYTLPPARMEALRDIHRNLPLGGRVEDDHLRRGDEVFAPGDSYGRTTELYESELQAITAVVADAGRQANWVIVSSHTHEQGSNLQEPPRFLVEFAHAVIDAGADVFVGHGPHVLRGIEIYKGKPVFYSLGNFLFQVETLARQPADNYKRVGLDADSLPGQYHDAVVAAMDGGFPARPAVWQSVVAEPVFREGALESIRLHPITLGHGLARPQRGRPMKADEKLSRRIIDALKEHSEPFGTAIEYDGGVGVIRP